MDTELRQQEWTRPRGRQLAAGMLRVDIVRAEPGKRGAKAGANAGIGPGFRASFAWLRADDVDAQHAGRELSAAWAGPLLLAQLGVHSGSPWQALLGVEAGYVVIPIEGQLDDTRTLLAVSGLWLTGRLGASYRW